jgi:hypothetical protein
MLFDNRRFCAEPFSRRDVHNRLAGSCILPACNEPGYPLLQAKHVSSSTTTETSGPPNTRSRCGLYTRKCLSADRHAITDRSLVKDWIVRCRDLRLSVLGGSPTASGGLCCEALDVSSVFLARHSAIIIVVERRKTVASKQPHPRPKRGKW